MQQMNITSIPVIAAGQDLSGTGLCLVLFMAFPFT